MKKFILAVAAMFLAASMVSAQDMAEATEQYNNGATALSTKNYTSALDYFRKALEMGTAIGEEADEIVANCKEVIPGVILQIAKNHIKEGQYTEAEAQIAAAVEAAQEYGNEAVLADAKELAPQMWLKMGNDALKIKDFEGAAEGLRKSYDLDTTNASTAIKLGQTLAALGRKDEALDIFQHAIWNGEEEEANKQISNMFLKEANVAYKAKKLAEAVEAANKANSYAENATAYLIAGQASQKLNKNSDAVENLEKYLELKPDASNASAITFTIAALYQGMKNNSKALEFYKKVENDAQFGAQAKQMISALSK
ncbi:MAG: tetratricopeptide repeat protein [Candidatus Cryptobacteroides sp.]